LKRKNHKAILNEEVGMTSIINHSGKIQTTSESNPSPPSWFSEVVLLTAHPRKHGVFNTITEQVRFARRRFGRYELIDFLVVLFGYAISRERTLLRLDGQYGNGAVLSDVAGFAFVTRGKDYHLLDHPLIQARLHLPPDQFQQRPESQIVRNLYDCPQIPVGPEGTPYRVVVATHPNLGKRSVPLG
jgi:hypothetical protein